MNKIEYRKVNRRTRISNIEKVPSLLKYELKLADYLVVRSTRQKHKFSDAKKSRALEPSEF